METITVLTDEIFHNPTVLQLDQGHVRRRRNGLQRVDSGCCALPPLGLKRPCSFWASKIRNSGRRRYTCTGKYNKMLPLPDQFCEQPGLSVKLFWGIGELRERDFVGCPGHF